MPINYTIVKSNLYDWAVGAVPVGMPVIYYNPNAPRPTVPYVTLYLNSITAVNQDYSYPNADSMGVINMKGDRNFTLQVQAYGGEPLNVLENMRSSLQKVTILDALRTAGIAFYQSLTITDITELVDSKFERRAQMDILFGIGQTYTDNPGYFNTVVVDETILNVDETIVYEDTITIVAP